MQAHRTWHHSIQLRGKRRKAALESMDADVPDLFGEGDDRLEDDFEDAMGVSS